MTESILDTAHDFIFVWLDRNIEQNKDNQDVKTLIRQLVRGRLRTFTEPNQCIHYILYEVKTKHIYFIVSNELGPNTVPRIHECPRIHSIYIYCGYRKHAEEWKKRYPKITAIFTEKQELLKRVCQDVRACYKDRQVPMSVFDLSEQENSLQNVTRKTVDMMWYHLLLDVLRMMARYGNSKAEMINECRTKYRDDPVEQTKIDQFEQTYNPTKAFWWYTYDSCIYRLLNTALRTQNTEIIFKFRFFIHDLHNQIERLYQQYLQTHSSIANHRVTVYRGQRLDMNEIELLKRSEEQLISMNSFLSATRNKELAEIFAGTSDQSDEASPLQSVLFIITVCDMTKETTPFAFIQEYSCCQIEEEVLFSIGAIFKVQSVIRVGQTWHVSLELSKQTGLCQTLMDDMKKQIGPEPGPLSFGWFLYRKSEFNKAERYAEFILKTLPPNDKGIGDAYNLLGLICKDKKELPKSIEYYKKALNTYSRLNLRNSSQTINAHNNLGLAFLALGDTLNASEQRDISVRILKNTSFDRDLLLTVQTDSLTARIHAARGDYNSAMRCFENVLTTKYNIFRSNHPSIATTLNDIGCIYEDVGDNEQALNYFNRASQIYKNSLPSDHIDHAECLENMARIHQKNKQYALASQQFHLASNIKMNSMRDENKKSR